MKSVSLISFILMLFSTGSALADVTPGSPAPEFSLVDQYSRTHNLSDYRGQWLVLYFYPRDDTPGCTTEACNFRDDIYRLRDMNVEVIGISVDNVESHARFAEKHGLPFPLLSDPDGNVASLYGSIFSLGPLKLAKRHTFIIDPEGNIAKVYRKVRPEKHSEVVISDLAEIQAM